MAYYLADTNTKLDMAVDLINYTTKSIFFYHGALVITQEGTPLQAELTDLGPPFSCSAPVPYG